MKVWYKTLSGESKPLNANCHESIENVKLKISRVEGLSLDQVHLIYQSNPVDQGNLNDLGVKEGDTFVVVIRNPSVIRINIRQPNGSQTVLEVEPSELVQNIKTMVETKLGYLVDQQVLTLDSYEVKEGRLTHHGITENSTLVLRLKTLQVFVKDFGGKTHTFVVHGSDTVDQFKTKIKEQLRIPLDQQQLLYGSNKLKGGQLSQYGIRDGSQIQLVGRLHGGQNQ